MTRILVKLRATDRAKYERDYYRDVQGLIFNLLRGSKFDIHDKRGRKFFSYSQIFPFHDLHKGDMRNLIIASPNEDFISYLKDQLEYLQDLRIGAMIFKVENIILMRMLHDKLDTLITGTPIVSSIAAINDIL